MADNNKIGEVYSTDFEYWEGEDGLLLLESWARDGYTISDIASRIGITRQSFERWMRKSEEITAAVNTGRELVDYKVENALLKSALGFKTREVKVTTTIRHGKVVEKIKETVDKEFAPNVSACQTWLYNRKPDKWKSMNSRNSLLDDLEQDTSIQIKVVTAGTNSAQPASGSFEEPDTDWQRDVNKEITISKSSESGKKSDEQQRDNSYSVSDGKKAAKKSSGNKSSQSGIRQHAREQDLDYWPDDWEDDEEW